MQWAPMHGDPSLSLLKPWRSQSSEMGTRERSDVRLACHPPFHWWLHTQRWALLFAFAMVAIGTVIFQTVSPQVKGLAAQVRLRYASQPVPSTPQEV